MKNIYISLPVGQSLRDFLDLGVLDYLLEKDHESNFILLTPAFNQQQITDKVKSERVFFREMQCPSVQPPLPLSYKLKSRVFRGNNDLRKLRLKQASAFELPQYLKAVWEEFPPSLVVLTHPMTSHEVEVYLAALKFGNETLGVVKSWDNLRKGLTCLCDKISVWNEINFAEAVKYNHYKESEVKINGAVSFDPYVNEEKIPSKEELCKQFNLDPEKPIITLATCGNYNLGYYEMDETHLMDDLLSIKSRNVALKDAQIVIRLHPVSRYLHFEKYLQHDFVRLSHGEYVPTIGWYTGPESYQEQIGLLAHSDLIVTPASSWVLESSIFDTPCVVPVYSNIQPYHAHAQFNSFTLTNHFKPIVENGWAVFANSTNEMEKECERAIQKPELAKETRRQLKEKYILFNDGMSYSRLGDWILARGS